MGYGTISGGGPDGRYTVAFDFGITQKTELLAVLAQSLVSINAQIATAQGLIDAAAAREAASLASLNVFFDALADAQQENPDADFTPGFDLYRDLLDRHLKLVAQGEPARQQMVRLRAAKAEVNKRIAYWNSFEPALTKECWCCDFTEDASGQVATLEVNGEQPLILVAPGGRAWTPADGVLSARELMSPEQAYFNVAILPGWQVDKPTYRWGTLATIDWDANTARVSLGEALSSAQRLPINTQATLDAVPFSYMTCNARSFSIGDRVVVQFLGQSWAAPQIIGYLDTPRPCPPSFSGTIPAQTCTEGEAFSYDVSGFWTGGADPLEYSIASGALPAGLSLNSATGVISGTPTDPDDDQTGVVIRCADAFYEASNRRYDDSNAFAIAVNPAATYYSGAVDHISFVASTGDKEVNVRFGSSSTSYNVSTNYSGTGTPPALDSFVWCTFVSGFPPSGLYRRMTVVGDNPGGPTTGVWDSFTGSEIWAWVVSTFESESASYTIEIATDSGGANIVATITGSIYVESF